MAGTFFSFFDLWATCGDKTTKNQEKKIKSKIQNQEKKLSVQNQEKKKQNPKNSNQKKQTPNHPKIPEEIGGGCFFQKISQNFYRHVTSPHWGHNTEIEGWKSITVSTYTFCIYRIIEIIISFCMINHVKLKLMNNII